MPSGARVALFSDRWLSQPNWASYGIQVVRPGVAPFERLVQDPPDAVVVDLSAGDNRWLDLCWRLHDLLRVPLVVVAPDITSAETVALLDRGADEVLSGPSESLVLAARVNAILRRTLVERPPETPFQVRLGAVTVDLATRTVRRGGESTVLSRTEFQLFQALLAARGRVSSHAELASRVWGSHQPAATRYLRLYIRYLRQKLEVNPDAPRYLLNIWGQGYQLLTDEPGQNIPRAAQADAQASQAPPQAQDGPAREGPNASSGPAGGARAILEEA